MSRSSLDDSPFMLACRRKPAPRTPVWLMRQAGRYMPEYRRLREQHSFLQLCKNPSLAAEITCMPIEKLGFDAAILFADLLLIVEPLGFSLTYEAGDGPSIGNPIREPQDVDRVRDPEAGSLDYVIQAAKKTRASLPAHTPLIGFAGAPFTLAAYLIEGDTSRTFVRTKRFMWQHPEAWRDLLQKIAAATASYLNRQIVAGVQAVQVFDSWVGCLSPEDYRTFVLPHTRSLIAALTPGTPVIHFGTDTSSLLEGMKQAGGDVIGLDWRVSLGDAWKRLGDVAVMGNLDPTVLLSDPKTIRRHARRILDEAAARPGHIFNLGHGILPDTPIDNVRALLEEVRSG